MNRLASDVRDKRAQADDVVRADPQVVAAAQAAGVYEGNDYAPQVKAKAQSWVQTNWARTVRR